MKQQTADSRQQTADSRPYCGLLIITNLITLLFLIIISLHYQVPQKVINKMGIIKLETASNRYTYLNYRQMAIHSLVNGQDGFEIVMLGDSITEWANWNELLNRDDIANFGIGGDRASYLLYRLFDIYLVKPKKCFLMIGINDFIGNDTVENVFENYKSIIEDIKGHNIEIIIQSTLYMSKKASRFEHIDNKWEKINIKVNGLNELLKEYCIENNITFLNINDTLSRNKILEEENTPDGVHLNKNGYEKWKEILIEYL
jgi:lysophospholipase L1-like esterase